MRLRITNTSPIPISMRPPVPASGWTWSSGEVDRPGTPARGAAVAAALGSREGDSPSCGQAILGGGYHDSGVSIRRGYGMGSGAGGGGTRVS
jgi:hypothetical protein